MALGLGARLGPYSVTAKIGEGGMGEVYRARDTKLDRDVALKVLPDAFASDPDPRASSPVQSGFNRGRNLPVRCMYLRCVSPNVSISIASSWRTRSIINVL